MLLLWEAGAGGGCEGRRGLGRRRVVQQAEQVKGIPATTGRGSLVRRGVAARLRRRGQAEQVVRKGVLLGSSRCSCGRLIWRIVVVQAQEVLHHVAVRMRLPARRATNLSSTLNTNPLLTYTTCTPQHASG